VLPHSGIPRRAYREIARYPVLIAAAFYTAADEDLDFLVSYARAGGHVLHNWSWEEATATASSAVTDLIGGGRHLPGEKITLGARDVRLFRGGAGE
jgi:hypothetical protein